VWSRLELLRDVRWKKRKGYGIGYVLAASSCKGASSVGAPTVAALDVIAAFAVPTPDCSSQGSWFFRVWWLDELPLRAGHPAYFGLANVLLDTNPFDRRQFFTLVFPNCKRSNVRHKFYELRGAFVEKRDVLLVRDEVSDARQDETGHDECALWSRR
jgi:hypothetical protein